MIMFGKAFSILVRPVVRKRPQEPAPLTATTTRCGLETHTEFTSKQTPTTKLLEALGVMFCHHYEAANLKVAT